MARRLKERLCCLNTQSNVARLHCTCTMRCLQPLCSLVCSPCVAVLTLYYCAAVLILLCYFVLCCCCVHSTLFSVLLHSLFHSLCSIHLLLCIVLIVCLQNQVPHSGNILEMHELPAAMLTTVERRDPNNQSVKISVPKAVPIWQVCIYSHLQIQQSLRHLTELSVSRHSLQPVCVVV